VSAPQRILLLILFAAAAWWRIALGSPLPAGHALSAEMVGVPPVPAGWSLVEERPLRDIPDSPGRIAVFRAPDGTKLTVHTRIAWADRRNLPVAFYPDDCSFLGTGWDFIVRGAEDAIGPGVNGHRIEVQRDKERLVLLSAYSCAGRVTGSWHDFKMALIWQRVRRERKLWTKSVVICPPSGDARTDAAKALLAAVTSGLRGN
jgi:hypothetical protein